MRGALLFSIDLLLLLLPLRSVGIVRKHMGRTQGKEGHKYSALLRHTDCVTPKLSIIIIIVIKSGVKAAAKLSPSLSHIVPMVLLFLEH